MAKKKNTIPSGFEGILDNIFTNPEEGEGVTNIDDMNTFEDPIDGEKILDEPPVKDMILRNLR